MATNVFNSVLFLGFLIVFLIMLHRFYKILFLLSQMNVPSKIVILSLIHVVNSAPIKLHHLYPHPVKIDTLASLAMSIFNILIIKKILNYNYTLIIYIYIYIF